jgi:hypothetical protein
MTRAHARARGQDENRETLADQRQRCGDRALFARTWENQSPVKGWDKEVVTLADQALEAVALDRPLRLIRTPREQAFARVRHVAAMTSGPATTVMRPPEGKIDGRPHAPLVGK